MFSMYPEHAAQSADLTFAVRDREIRVHSQIMALTSPVLSEVIASTVDRRIEGCFGDYEPAEVFTFAWIVYNGAGVCLDYLALPGAARLAHMLDARGVMDSIEKLMVRLFKSSAFSPIMHKTLLTTAEDFGMWGALKCGIEASSEYVSSRVPAYLAPKTLMKHFRPTTAMAILSQTKGPFPIMGFFEEYEESPSVFEYWGMFNEFYKFFSEPRTLPFEAYGILWNLHATPDAFDAYRIPHVPGFGISVQAIDYAVTCDIRVEILDDNLDTVVDESSCDFFVSPRLVTAGHLVDDQSYTIRVSISNVDAVL
jgi:hypothetical protein